MNFIPYRDRLKCIFNFKKVFDEIIKNDFPVEYQRIKTIAAERMVRND